MRRVLEIPEIVELIFSFLDKHSNAINAMVCKKWSELALNILWREVEVPSRLFGKFAPLKVAKALPRELGKGRYEFTRSLEAGDWEDFARYARRVRSLHVSETSDTNFLSKELLDEVARSRIWLNVLPGLRELHWLTPTAERMRFSFIFMHSNITHFAVSLHPSDGYPISAFFKEVLLRMPNLTVLDLRFRLAAKEIENNIRALLQGLPKLKQIILPVYTWTSGIVEEASKLPNLGTIQFEFMEPQGRGSPADVLDFAPRLEEGAFPALWDIALSARLPDITNFLTGSFAPSKLTTLYIHVISAAQPEVVTNFVTAVSESCKLLQSLYFEFLGDVSEEVGESESTISRLDWGALRPLLTCANLVVFEIRWYHPLTISYDDLEEMASNWPFMETLMLNCEPVDISIPPTLTLHALTPFARHCPKLVELGLYMSASVDVETPLERDVLAFQALRRLFVGLSRIADPGPVSLFLSKLCPLNCEVSSGVTWPDGFEGLALPEMERAADEWGHMWTEVNQMLPLLVKLRMEERENRQALQKEVEDLRVRCRLLSDRADIKMPDDDRCVPF
ncbi:hypothetical protein EW026_g7380 [Hermanssonia centrifuga]|nr:hypothetical protein EW026_g7380 [Hermanssonia centrifuga]